MSKFTESLRQFDIHNAWGYAGTGNPYIVYIPGTTGRGSRSPHIQVVRPGYQTDPKAHWMDYGSKTFHCWSSTKQATIAEAQAWAGERYKITAWEKTPYGTWMSADFVKARNAELKARLKALKNTVDKPPEQVVE